MTSKNMSLNNKPFLLRPIGKDYLWGGRRLNDDFSKDIPMQPLAETWECSTHHDGTSMVASGEFKGLSLAEVLRSNPGLLGKHYADLGELPILIKLIDAKRIYLFRFIQMMNMRLSMRTDSVARLKCGMCLMLVMMRSLYMASVMI